MKDTLRPYFIDADFAMPAKAFPIWFWVECLTNGKYKKCPHAHIDNVLREEPIMAKVELNTQAPEFTLLDFNGISVSLSNFTDRKNVLVVFNRGFF